MDTIKNSEFVWRAFQRWIRERTLVPDDAIPWSDIRENFGDYTLEGAIDHAPNDELTGPLLSPSQAIQDEATSMREALREELEKIIAPAREQGIPEATIRKALEDLGVQFTINRVQRGVPKKAYDEALEKLAELRKRIFEMVPVGQPREVRVERISRTPAPETVQIERPQERYAQVLGQRILSNPNLLEVLGVEASASDEEVRNARNTLLTLFHPDVYHGPNANEITRKINQAYEALATVSQREAYAQRASAQIPTVQVQAGQPIAYCDQDLAFGRMVIMVYDKTLEFKTGRSYQIYKCPANPNHKDRIANFKNGQFLGWGK